MRQLHLIEVYSVVVLVDEELFGELYERVRLPLEVVKVEYSTAARR